MKFSEMPYARPDLNELKQQLQALTDQLKSAPDYASAHEAFLAQQKLSTHIDTLATLSSVRNSIDTRDKFYDAEEEFWNEAGCKRISFIIKRACKKRFLIPHTP